MTQQPPMSMTREQELLLRIARRPGFCCCCLCLAREDRLRARRIFRLTRKVTKAWRKEQEEAARAAEQGSERDRS